MGIDQKIPYLTDLFSYILRVGIIYAGFYLLSRYLSINLILAGVFTIFIAQHLSNTTKILLVANYFLLSYVLNQFIFSELSTLVIHGLISITLTGITLLDLNMKIQKEARKQHINHAH